MSIVLRSPVPIRGAATMARPCQTVAGAQSAMQVLDSFLLPQLGGKGYIVLDGGLGTSLDSGVAQKHVLWGMQLLLTEDGRGKISDVHTDFLRAGADIILTSSYKVSKEILTVSGAFDGAFPDMFPGIADSNEQERFADELLCETVRIAQHARDVYWNSQQEGGKRPRPLVAAAVGPAGDNCRIFVGTTDPNTVVTDLSDEVMEQYYRRKLSSLVKAGPDLIAIETMPSLREAELAQRILSEIAPCMPLVLSLICTSEDALPSGDMWVDAIRALQSRSNVVALGLNCTAPQFVRPLLTAASAVTTKPLVAYPNSGELWDARPGHRHWHDDEGMMKVLKGEDAVDMYRCGACIIGGCCKVGHAQIAQFREALDGMSVSACNISSSSKSKSENSPYSNL